ncbi:hypothetical protein [Aquimarina sp. LLG6339-5]|uniref:hypothetical protein n=1 Tax=Aquimarina sp. LLG6339-5 TaxID=3160830 RepID=UPI003864236C
MKKGPSKKLALNKLKIAKLEKMNYIRGGGGDDGETILPDPPYSDDRLNPDCWIKGGGDPDDQLNLIHHLA